MKKTLIAIMALAGMAAAADVTVYDDVLFTKTQSSTLDKTRGQLILGEQELTLKSWIIEFKITTLQDVGTFVGTARNTGGNERGGLAIRTNSPTGLSLTINQNAGYVSDKLEIPNVADISSTNPITLRWAYDSTNGIAYLYDVINDKYVSTEGFTFEAADAYQLKSVASTVTGESDKDGYCMFWTDGGKEQYTIISVTDMSKVTDKSVFKSYVVPEPATATLSLLALIGLASRRRRH